MDRMKKKRRKPGPKPKPAAQKYSAKIDVPMLQSEREILEREARRLGITTAQLIMRPWREKWGKEGG